MDTLDIKILRGLLGSEPYGHCLINPRIPLSHVARRLGVDKDTVSNRLKKLRETGFIRGWVAFANPSLFGVKETRLRFDVPAHTPKDDLVRKLRLIPGVGVIANLYGDSMQVGVLYETEESLRKSTELISRISSAEDMIRFDNVFPECTIKLSETDRDIIRCIRKNPRKSYKLVSKELGLSSRTVKRRLERLIDGKAISAVMAVDLNSVDGTMVSLLAFYANPENSKEMNDRILSYLDDCVFRAELGDKGHGFFNLIISNVARVQEISRWMRQQPDVSGYRVDLVQEFIQQSEALSDLIDRSPVKVQLHV